MSARATPYQGLVPYSEQDAEFFFGRDPDIELITANLAARRFTVLYGPSGVGKSSVLRAGVAHQLRQRARENLAENGAPEFAAVVFSSWRDDPIAGLIARVEDEVTRTLSNGHDARSSAPSPTSLSDALKEASARVQGDLLLILDQFEEYFLYHGSEEGDGTFDAELPRLLTTPAARVHVLVSIREDALAKLDRFEGRIPNLFKNFLRIDHLGRDAAREAIEKPLAQYNALIGREEHGSAQTVTIEPALVEAVLDQVKTGQVFLAESGQGVVDHAAEDENRDARIETPYLQLVMTRLWDETLRADSHTLRLETLERLGGAEKIVRTHLDTTMGALPEHEQRVAANIFNFLVTPSGTKIAHTARDLADYSHMPQNEIAATLEKLSGGDIRILRPVAPPLDQPTEPRYEIFHDVLGAPILDWRARFVQQQEKIESEKKLAAEKRRVQRLRLGLIGVSLLLLAVIALAVFALTQQQAAQRASAEAETQKQEAERQKADALAQKDLAEQEKQNAEAAKQNAIAQQNIARAGELAALSLGQLSSDPERALLIAREAFNTAQTAQTEDALRTALLDPYRYSVQGKGSWITDARITADGKYAVTLEPCGKIAAVSCGSVRIWDMEDGALLSDLALDTDAQKIDVSADGNYLVTAQNDNVARVWEIPSGKLVSELRGQQGKINDVRFSPDGKQVVAGGNDPTVRVWDATTGSLLHELGHRVKVFAAGFSPNGLFLAASDVTGFSLWDVNKETRIWKNPSFFPGDILFSPDGRFIAGDYPPSVWSIATGAKIAEMKDAPMGFSSFAYSPNGKYILAGDIEGTLRVYDSLTGANEASLPAHILPINSVRFSPTGHYFASAGDDNRARLWLLTEASSYSPLTVEAVQDLNGHSGGVNSVTFSPDGQSILTASNDGTARLWHVNSGIVLKGHKDFVTAAAYSPNGKQIATASKDGTARIWDAQTHKTLYELRGHMGALNSIAYNRDGSQILTSSDDKTARVWDAATGQTIFTLGDADNAITAPAFSRDGKWIAAGVVTNESGTLKNRVVIWDLQNKNILRQADANCGKNTITRVAWSADSKTLLAACDNATLAWIDATNGGVQVLNAPNPLTQLSRPTFSPDGKRAAASGSSNNVLVWDLTTNPPTRITLDGYFQGSGDLQFSPDGNYLVTTGGEKTLRLWDARSGKFVREFKGHTDTISRAVFSPDGRFIVTASNDKTARVWETTTGKLIETLYGHGDILTDASFSPDGKMILTAGDSTARVYECIECASPQEMLELANARATRALTCEERVTFLHETIDCANP